MKVSKASYHQGVIGTLPFLNVGAYENVQIIYMYLL